MALQLLGHRRGHVDGTGLLPLRQGEVQPATDRLYLAADVEDASRVVDVLRAQPKHLALTEPASQADYDGYPVSWADDVADSQRRLQPPRVASLLRRLWPPHGLRTHGVPGEPLVVASRFQNGGELGQNAALVVDRGDG